MQQFTLGKSYGFDELEVKLNYATVTKNSFNYKNLLPEVHGFYSLFDKDGQKGVLSKTEIKKLFDYFIAAEKRLGNGDGTFDIHECADIERELNIDFLEDRLLTIIDFLWPRKCGEQEIEKFEKKNGIDLEEVSHIEFGNCFIDSKSRDVYLYDRYDKTINATHARLGNYERYVGPNTIVITNLDESAIIDKRLLYKKGPLNYCKIDLNGNGEKVSSTKINDKCQYRTEKVVYVEGRSQGTVLQARNYKGQVYTNPQYAAQVLGLTPETERCGFLWKDVQKTGRYGVEAESSDCFMRETWYAWDEKQKGFVLRTSFE